MGWVLIFVIVVSAVFILYGWHTGLMKMLFHLLSLVAALIIASIVGPIVANLLISNDSVMLPCQEKVYETLSLEKLANVEQITEVKLQTLALPDIITEQIATYVDTTSYKENYEKLGVDNAADFVAKSVAMIIIRCACYIVVFLVALIALLILCKMTDIVFKFVGIDGLNKALGALAGLIEAAIIICVVFAIITAFSNTEFGSSALEQISNDAFLSWIYDHSVVSWSVVDISKFFK